MDLYCISSVCFNPCGNGIIGGIETCDDGNLNNYDGCNEFCLIEENYICAVTSLCLCLEKYVGINLSNPSVSLHINGAIANTRKDITATSNTVSLPINCSFISINSNNVSGNINLIDNNTLIDGAISCNS